MNSKMVSEQKGMDGVRQDSEGNIIGCPKCGSRSLRKDGFSNFKSRNKKQV